MSTQAHDATLAELVGRLAKDVPDLLQHEIRLARAELLAATDAFTGAAQSLAAGALLTAAATGLLVTAAVAGLAALLVALGVEPVVALAISALAIGAGVGIAAWIVIRRASETMRQARASLENRARGLAADVALVMEKR